MSDEIVFTYNLAVTNGSFKDTFAPTQQRYDQTAQGFHSAIAIVGTSEETLDQGDISTPGIAVFQNLDGTNFVTLGPDSSGMVGSDILKPGEIVHKRLVAGTTYKWIADTADCKVLYKIYED